MANSVNGRCRIWQFLKSEPYSPAVLYAKISALINRSIGNILSSDKLTVGNIALHLSSQQVFIELHGGTCTVRNTETFDGQRWKTGVEFGFMLPLL